jgi:hypothetical protein
MSKFVGCYSCGEELDDISEMEECEICGQEGCYNCMVTCDNCGRLVCNDCYDFSLDLCDECAEDLEQERLNEFKRFYK